MPTFMMTDIEDSTKLWEKHTDTMTKVIALHNLMIQETLDKHGGKLIKSMGDGVFVVFQEGSDPLKCAIEIQKRIQRTTWGPIKDIRVRVGLHTGPAKKLGEDYFGPTINRTARVMAMGKGGQILLTPNVIDEHELPPGASIRDMGAHVLKGLTREQIILGLEHPELKNILTSLDTVAADITIRVPEPAPVAKKEPAVPLRGLSATFDQTHTYEMKTTVGGRGMANGQFLLPTFAAVDRQDRVYISDAIRCIVQVFEPSGEYLKRIGAQGTPLELELTLNNPTALAVDSKDRVYICDTKNSRVVIVDTDGNIIHRVGRPLVVMGLSEPPGVVGFNFPRGIALDEAEGQFYVSDTGNNRLRLFNLDGGYVRTFGMWGQGAGEFVLPLGLAVGPRGTLYVADSDNYRIQVFERGFRHVRTFGRRGPAPADFYKPPLGIAVTPDSDLLVSDGTGRIKIFAGEGSYIGSFSGKRLSSDMPHYCSVTLKDSTYLVTVDEHNCRWHRYEYKEILD